MTAPDHEQAEQVEHVIPWHGLLAPPSDAPHAENCPRCIIDALAAQLAEAQENFKQTRELLDFKQRCLDGVMDQLAEAQALRERTEKVVVMQRERNGELRAQLAEAREALADLLDSEPPRYARESEIDAWGKAKLKARTIVEQKKDG